MPAFCDVCCAYQPHSALPRFAIDEWATSVFCPLCLDALVADAAVVDFGNLRRRELLGAGSRPVLHQPRPARQIPERSSRPPARGP